MDGLTYYRSLREIQFTRRGWLEIAVDREQKLRLAGIRVKVEQQALGRARSFVIEPSGLRLTDGGQVLVSAHLGGLMPLAVGSDTLQTIALPEFVKLFGVQVWRSR